MLDLEKIKRLYLSTREKEEVYAASIGISQSHFSNCLHGVKHFSMTVLKNIAKRHRCDLTDLMLEEEGLLINQIQDLRIQKLTNEEMEGILKIVSILESHSLLEDKEIREDYYKLLEKITKKIGGY